METFTVHSKYLMLAAQRVRPSARGPQLQPLCQRSLCPPRWRGPSSTASEIPTGPVEDADQAETPRNNFRKQP